MHNYYTADQEEAEYKARLPICADCRKPIESDECFEFCNDVICENCLDLYHKRKTVDFISE